MTSADLLIVGASQAGVQLASSVRELGWTGRIALIGAERHPPYARPALSKAFLQGQADRESLIFRDPSFYEQQHIDLVLGEAVEHLSMTDGGAGFARTASGRRFPFDRLALATGARPPDAHGSPERTCAASSCSARLDDAERLVTGSRRSRMWS